MRLASLIPEDDSDHISFRHCGHTYRVGECIGKGGFGSVFSVLGKPQLVIKKILIKTKRQLTLIQQEIELTRMHLDHPFIIRSFEEYYDTDNQTMYILYERIQGIPLNTHIEQWASEPSDTARASRWHIARQVCCGMHYLHTQGFTHRDIKPHNIMIQEHPLHVKLIDFGLSQRSDANTGSSGSKTYNAPEKFDAKYPQTHAVDLWSLGCLLFHLFFCTTIFTHSKTKAFDKKNAPAIPNIHHRLHQHLNALIAESEPNTSQILPLIRALLHRDPEQRPSGHEAYEYLTVHAQDIAPVDHDCLHPSQSDGDTKH